MSAEPRQLPLDLAWRPALGRQDFLVAPGNAAAVSQVVGWQAWAGRRLAVAGPARSGKTHLAHVWMHESGAVLRQAEALDPACAAEAAAAGRVVVEDGDRLAGAEAEQGLLHLHNLLAAEGGWLMLTGRTPPAAWPVRLPDLVSRLKAIPVARMERPSDAVLSRLLLKLFSDRQLLVRPEVIDYLLARMERSVAEAERIVTALDRRSLAARRGVTQAMARAVLEEGGGRED